MHNIFNISRSQAMYLGQMQPVLVKDDMVSGRRGYVLVKCHMTWSCAIYVLYVLYVTITCDMS